MPSRSAPPPPLPRSPLTRRAFAGLAGAAAATALAGCASQDTSKDLDTLQVWGGVPPENGPQAVVDHFMEEHPDRNVTYTRFVNDDRGNLKVNTALQGGVDIDVYRLPKASHTFDHKWQTEWPRIRETEHERLLVDHHGMFYELSPWAYGGRIWGLRPISTHLWVLGDFCSWKGMLVLGADNASPSGGKNVTTAEPQSGLWFGKTDDLWGFGKPSGWGGPWWRAEVRAGEASDPYLMTGFDNKCLHLENHGERAASFDIEVDIHGDGHFSRSERLTVGAGELLTHVFPSGFSAHWVRVVPDADTTASAQLFYT